MKKKTVRGRQKDRQTGSGQGVWRESYLKRQWKKGFSETLAEDLAAGCFFGLSDIFGSQVFIELSLKTTPVTVRCVRDLLMSQYYHLIIFQGKQYPIFLPLVFFSPVFCFFSGYPLVDKDTYHVHFCSFKYCNYYPQSPPLFTPPTLGRHKQKLEGCFTFFLAIITWQI